MFSGIIEELVMMVPLVEVAEVNECLQSSRDPSVAGADPSVVSPSGAELEGMHQSMGKAQQWKKIWETWGKMVQGREGGKVCKVKMAEEWSRRSSF